MGRSNVLLHLRKSAKGAETSTGLISKYLRREAVSQQQLVDQKTKSGGSIGKREVLNSSYSCLWIPHPRTGIYFPVGHDWVMEDVPEGAATFTETCCFRNE
ncbi:hypothetical protein TSUD_115390 [Trifolium subterraneum]|uniref:Uncharacterized protein n=1 Tax=Trifolium subterraneum TaxID=3900 RepID=A0A2Z6NIH4_TRISU|nr:hypothetical protein TSUD_115390 [Trifolium subterraneum]